MFTKQQLQSEVLAFIANHHKSLIEDIYQKMYEAAKEGKDSIKYPMHNGTLARQLTHYFHNQGFDSESSWEHWNQVTNEGEDWYLRIFWY